MACTLTTHAQDAIKIGYTADQSGTGVAELGIAGRWGFEAAIEDINKAGGILGRKVVGVIRDDQGTPPKAIQTVQDLLDSEKVQALVGPANSGNALAWLHPAAKKIPVVVPIGTATEITTRYAKAAKLPVPHLDGRPGAGRLAGAYALKASKDKKIAVLADSTGYGRAASRMRPKFWRCMASSPWPSKNTAPRTRT
jgi:branched-chain amino acid transport system substrate-binding protein